MSQTDTPDPKALAAFGARVANDERNLRDLSAMPFPDHALLHRLIAMCASRYIDAIHTAFDRRTRSNLRSAVALARKCGAVGE